MAQGLSKRGQPQKQAARVMNSDRVANSRAELICAGAVFLVAILLYTVTLAPTVTLVDSGELIVAARGLGVAHPPGFPLWVMLAHLASLLQFGNVAMAINFSSALFAALACAMLTLVVAELLMTVCCTGAPKRNGKAAHQSRKGEQPTGDRFLVLAPAVCAGLLMAFSRTLWSYATITEVYALNALLILVVFFLVLRWRRRILESRRDASAAVTTYDAWIYTAAFVFGLALGVHHVTVGLTLPAIAALVYHNARSEIFH